MLPGRGPGRGPPRPPGREHQAGPPCPWPPGPGPPCPGPPCPEPLWPAPPALNHRDAGRGPGPGAGRGQAARAAARRRRKAPGEPGPAAGQPGAGPLAGAAWPCRPRRALGRPPGWPRGLAAGWGWPAGRVSRRAAGACGRAGPGRGPGRPPLPSAGPAGAGAPCPWDLRPWALGPWAPNSSLSLRTTGASMVDDAERTNSPISWSLAITALLSTPNSFASSYTRTFATALPLSARLRRAIVADPGQRVLRPASASGSHRRVLIARSSQLIPLSRHCCRFSFDRLTCRARPGDSPAQPRAHRPAR